MTLMQHLTRLYDAIGEDHKENPPLPVGFSEQNAQIVVELDANGAFIQAYVKPKEEIVALIPVTFASASRTSKAVAHPLFDKMQYVAGDLLSYVDPASLTDRKRSTIEESHELFLSQLDEWIGFSESRSEDEWHRNTLARIQPIRTYVGKRCITHDLLQNGIFVQNERGYLDDKPKEKTDLLRLIGSQQEAFIEFRVSGLGRSNQVNHDADLQRSFREYLETILDEEDFCMIAGRRMKVSKLHPKRIRHAADGAKLISANDATNFTYRGRFERSDEALSIGYNTSEKSHSALKWLIAEQGYRRDDRVFLTFSTSAIQAVQPLAAPLFEMQKQSLPGFGVQAGSRTGQSHAEAVKRMLDGYKTKRDPNSKIVSLILDAATPGRLSILFYRELDDSTFGDNLARWYGRLQWELQRWNKEEKRFFRIVTTPTPLEMIYAAHGDNVSDTLIKNALERLFGCIVDGKNVPLDILVSIVNQASHPMGKEAYEWEKLLRMACALVHQRENLADHEYGEGVMEHYLNKKDRSTLYGRLLAVADFVEGRALNADERKRPTNAMRLMTAFSNRPFTTWKILNDAVRPYLSRGKGGLQTVFDKEVSRILMSFEPGDYESDKKLDALFLMGFYTQREKMWTRKSETETNSNAKPEKE